MSDFEDKNHEEIEDTPTLEEQQKIEAIQIATFVPPAKKEEPKPEKKEEKKETFFSR